MTRGALLALLAACGGGGHAHPPDAPVDAGCTATFSGNFADSSSGPSDCPTLGAGSAATELDFTVASMQLESGLAIAIDLGSAPAVGAYSSETVSSWSATAMRDVKTGKCALNAGTDAAPQGAFQLSLSAFDPAGGVIHGTATVQEPVHAIQFAACGDDLTEVIEVAF